MNNKQLCELSDDIHNALSRLEERFGIPADDEDLLIIHGADGELSTPHIIDQIRETEEAYRE